MTKTLLSTALLAMLGSAWSAPAAGPAPRLAIRPMADAAATQDASQRLIVRYRALPVSERSRRLGVVQSAARRAGLDASTLARGRPAARVERLRTLASGAELYRLSRPLGANELTRLLDEIGADPAVERVVPDRLLQPVRGTRQVLAPRAAQASPPDDPLYADFQWHLHGPDGGINVPEAWNTSTGEGVVVAVLDTGILPDHPDFADNLLEGYDFITDRFISRRDSDARAPGARDLGDWTEAGDCGAGWPASASTWHGTHVAGTVAEATGNGIGGAGVAFDAQVLPVRVLGRCGGYGSDIADAIAWASGGTVEGVPDNAHPAEVINLSLGGPGTCDAETQSAIDGAVARGSLVVVAAGNSNADAADFSPASCDNVVVVGANRITGGRASYSNFGRVVDIAAPGGGGPQDPGNDGWDGYILQTGYSGLTTPTSGEYQYTGMTGTSMASPHVAATAALVQSARVAAGRAPLPPDELARVLTQTARNFPVGIPAATPIGTGIVDAVAALAMALAPDCDDGDCGPDATPLEIGTSLAGQSSGTEDALYRVDVEPGTSLTVMTFGGTGDASLSLRRGAAPDQTHFLAVSQRIGNTEMVRLTAPQPGTYYVRLSGSYRGLTIAARR